MARPNLPQFEPEYDYYKMRTLVDEMNRWIDTVESGESGAGGGVPGGEHNLLTGRDAADAHPITAITGLTASLAGLSASIASNTSNIAFNAAGIVANAAAIAAHNSDLANPHNVTLQQTYDENTIVPQITLNATPDPFTIDASVAGDVLRVRDAANVDLLRVATTGITFANAYSFPTADGAADQILVTDGAGALTYQAQAISGGLLSAEYRFSTSIVAADPGSGRYRFDTAAYSTVTEIFIDDETDNGVDISNFLALISKGDRLYFQVKSNADRFVVFDVIVDAVDNTGWFTIGVNEIASGVFFSNNDKCLMVWGIDGDTRPQMRWYEGMSTRAFVFSDFMEPPGGLQVDGLQAIAAGAGSGVTTPTGTYDFTNHPGVWGLNTGATAAGRVFLLSQFAKGFQVGVGGITRHGCWYQAPAVISDAVNEYVLRSGFTSMALPNTILQGITFEYQFDQNGGRWQGLCEDGVGETSIDTGITVVVSTYYFLEFEVNELGTSVEFFIDNVSVGTVAANIPTGLAFEHFISEHIMKLAGGANRASYVDAYYFYQEVTR